MTSKMKFFYLTNLMGGESVWSPIRRVAGDGVEVIHLGKREIGEPTYIGSSNGEGTYFPFSKQAVILKGVNRSRIGRRWAIARAWEVEMWIGGPASGYWVSTLVASEFDADRMIGFREGK